MTRPGEDRALREYFNSAAAPHGPSAGGWAALEAEKLAAIGQRLWFVEQARPLGLGHAVYQARDFVAGEPFLLLLGDHVFISETKDRCALQAIRIFEELHAEAVTAVQFTSEQELRLFGAIRGQAVDAPRGIYLAQRIIEKPTLDQAHSELVTAGLPAGTYLAHFGIHIFRPSIFDSLRWAIESSGRGEGEVQLTDAQEHLRQRTGSYYAAVLRGQRYDAGIPYGLLETQLALGINGVHRTEVCESLLRIMAHRMKL